jgi:hypothetical protein
VGGSERVVHVEVGQPSQLPRQLRIVLLLSRIETAILQEYHVAGLHSRDRLLDHRACEPIELAHGDSEKPGQAGGHRIEAQVVVGGILGPAQV